MTFLIFVGVLAVLIMPYPFFLFKYEDRVDCAFYTFLFWVLFLVLVGLYAGVDALVDPSPTLATLSKDKWDCVSYHKETHMVGKTWVTVDVCDTYQMKGR